MSKQLARLLPGAVAALFLASCSLGLDPDSDTFSCESDEDCGEGFTCVAPFDNASGKTLPPRCVERFACVPIKAACNGVDDDCDGVADEADEVAAEIAELAAQDPGPFLYGADGANCHVDEPFVYGACTEGKLVCTGEKIECQSLEKQAAASDQTCNDIDDDCNDIVDDGVDKTVSPNCVTCGNTCSVTQRCAASGCVENSCGNGMDDDGDGASDCADDDCNRQPCGSGGAICRDFKCPTGCTGNEPQGEITCSDGLDNDCSGQADCADIHCLGQTCDPTGGNCGYSTTGQLGCQLQEVLCGNAKDDDGDGDVDCLDSACLGKTCDVGQNCGTLTSGGTPECVAVEAECSNGIDDDGDELTDCFDPDCLGQTCLNNPAKNCTATAGCEDRETACIDGTDNDRDTFTDCADSDCDEKICGVGCQCLGDIATETDCADGVDNNGDGFKDCADLTSCLDKSCGTDCICVKVGSRGVARELNCADGVNNDRDDDGLGSELVDCRDPDCAGVSCQVAGGPDCTCAPCPGGVCPLGEGSYCQNEIDDDGDELVDCADPDCDKKGCLNRGGCVCENGVPSEAPDKCFDNQDNDDDGSTDCADTDCEGDSCGAGCTCASGVKSEAASACRDGADNDGDGFTDCEDPDCDADSCGQGCTCVYDFDAGTGRKAETNCANGTDNDGDTLADCNDPDCNGLSCSDAGCLCVFDEGTNTGRRTETLCNDGVNNDTPGDQLIDCEDGDCTGKGCGSGIDPVETDDCLCQGGFAVEVDCSNGADDDIDLKSDCADPDCTGVSPCPSVDHVTPDNGPAGGGQSVTVFGTNFGIDENGDQTRTIDAIRFGGTACLNPSWVSETEASCSSTPAHASGLVSVEVENPGEFVGSKEDVYTYTTHLGSGLDDCQLTDQNVTAPALGSSGDIAGRVKEAGETNQQVSDIIVGNIGYGPDASDPRTDGSWKWFVSTVDVAGDDPAGDWDDHTGSFTMPEAGTYALMYRYSKDGGVSWLYCDASAADGFQTGKLTSQ